MRDLLSMSNERYTSGSDRSYPNWWGSCNCCICWKSSSLVSSCSLRHPEPGWSRYSTVPPRKSSIFSLYRNWCSYSRAVFTAQRYSHTTLFRSVTVIPLPVRYPFRSVPGYFVPPIVSSLDRDVTKRGNPGVPIAAMRVRHPQQRDGSSSYSPITRTIARSKG